MTINTVQLSSVIVVTVLAFFAYGVKDYGDLPPGPYCVRAGCCDGRVDECAAPLLTTRCYCDDFCNRTNDDCCPDFWSHCKGISIPEPIKACYHNGQYYPYNQEAGKENCNVCKCENVNGRMEVLCERNTCLMEENIINNVQRYSHGWSATNYSEFWGRKLEEGITLRLGTLQPQRFVMRMNPVRRIYDPRSLPTEFDSDNSWPGALSRVQDQGWCGSSWAISTAAVASDRYGIISKGVEKVQLSAQHLLSCNERGQQSCHGGYLDRAWMFTRKFGLVDEECFPYHGDHVRCSIPRTGTLEEAGCRVPIDNNREQKYRVAPVYRLGNETDIMHDILKSGPVQATMKVYHDFFSYRDGIYKRTDLSNSDRTGYHSVRIVGWGQENTYTGPQKYWKVANSWGTQWGERGYFRIARGSNECDIESFVLATWPETIAEPIKNIVY